MVDGQSDEKILPPGRHLGVGREENQCSFLGLLPGAISSNWWNICLGFFSLSTGYPKSRINFRFGGDSQDFFRWSWFAEIEWIF